MSVLTKQHEELAKLCQDIYIDDHLQMYDHIDEKDTDVQCAFVVNKDELIVVWRGSDSGTDWLHNAMVTQSEYPLGSGVYLHSGFLLKILSIKEIFKTKLKKHIEDSNGGIKKVVFTGHSLGQNCIIAAYVSFDVLGDLPVEIITYGGPRPGNGKFKEVIEKRCKCTRIVLDRDVVTRIPSFPSYEHCGDPIQIRETETLERETTCLEHLHWLLLGCLKADFGIKDHMIWNYYAAIRKRVSGDPESKTDSELKIESEDSELELEDDELKIAESELKISDDELKITDDELKFENEINKKNK